MSIVVGVPVQELMGAVPGRGHYRSATGAPSYPFHTVYGSRYATYGDLYD